MATPHSGKFVGYYRVSTAKQGKSGLGREAQEAAVQAYCRRVVGRPGVGALLYGSLAQLADVVADRA